MTQEEFEQKISNDWWLTTVESIKLNVADKIVQIKCNFKNEKEIVEIQTIFGDVTLTYMKCPQIAMPVKINYNFNENVNKSDADNIKNIIDSNYIKMNKNNKITNRFFDNLIDIVGNIGNIGNAI